VEIAAVGAVLTPSVRTTIIRLLRLKQSVPAYFWFGFVRRTSMLGQPCHRSVSPTPALCVAALAGTGSQYALRQAPGTSTTDDPPGGSRSAARPVDGSHHRVERLHTHRRYRRRPVAEGRGRATGQPEPRRSSGAVAVTASKFGRSRVAVRNRSRHGPCRRSSRLRTDPARRCAPQRTDCGNPVTGWLIRRWEDSWLSR
jgi:hypothetical protein